VKRYAIEIVRGIAALFIVGCHLNLTPRTPLGDFMTHYCDMFVGVFGAISGFLLALSLEKGMGNQGVSTAAMIKRKAVRLLPIYFIWTAVYVVFGVVFDLAFDGTIGSKFYSMSNWILFIFCGGSSCHLWYIAALFYVSVLYVVCWRVFTFVRKPLFWLVASILLLVVAVNWHSFWGYYFVRLASFMALGMFANLAQDKLAGIPLWLLVVALAAALVWHPWSCHAVYGDFVVAALLMALLANSVVERACARLYAKTVFLKSMADASLGIYLIHPIFCAGVGTAAVKKLSVAPYEAVWIAGDWVICYILSLLSVIVICRVGLNRFVK